MRRRAIRAGLAATVVATGLTIPGAGPARAGGGCHKPLSEGRGDTVAMAEACFSPSILRVDSPTEVTFLNKDSYTHNVSSNGWSSADDLTQGDRFRATFSRPGVYPFACTYHPGMVGAIVVGGEAEAGSGTTVAVTSSTEPTGAKEAANRPVPAVPTGDRGLAAGWIGGGILGLAVGAGLVLARTRRRPEKPAGP
jgi:plastocyanin